MILTYLFFGSFVAALTLIVFSAWLASRAAYLGIIVLLAAALVLAELRDGPQSVNVLALAVDVLIFGAFFYFVSVQYLMRRKASQITSREEFREAMQANNQFAGFAKALYHLPIYLLLTGVAVAAIGAYTSQ